MRLESVNVGRSTSISHGERSFVTGICKQPVEGAVEIGREGVRGDAIVATEHHGGADQAIYAYSADDYDWWAIHTTRDYFPGLFGENLRIPCSTFAARMGDSSFGIAFRDAERPGVYFRVLNEGEVAAGDAVTFIENEESDATILDLFRFYYARQHEVNALRRLLEAPLAERMRVKVEAKLAALT